MRDPERQEDGVDPDPPEGPGTRKDDQQRERLRRRALLLRELTEARQLRERVAPRRSKAQRVRQVMRMRSFRN